MRVWILIPAYNEELNLEILLDELRKKDVFVFVIDDGSLDNT
nr:glycosyltransferase [Candidatus Omnitrophota bacterium]